MNAYTSSPQAGQLPLSAARPPLHTVVRDRAAECSGPLGHEPQREGPASGLTRSSDHGEAHEAAGNHQQGAIHRESGTEV